MPVPTGGHTAKAGAVTKLLCDGREGDPRALELLTPIISCSGEA